MKISELMYSIKIQDLVLPEFQREYVWSKDQAKRMRKRAFSGNR